jgi:hypothetical protein
MSRLKSHCENPKCNRFIADAKLFIIPGSDKRLCNLCRHREEKRLREIKLRDSKPQLNIPMNNLSQKERKSFRVANFNVSYLTRDEEEVLRTKHKFDKFISGEKKDKQIIIIKDKLKDNKFNDINIDKHNKLYKSIKLKESKEKNKKFLDGLK